MIKGGGAISIEKDKFIYIYIIVFSSNSYKNYLKG